jgi:hypothetical protein
VGVYFLAGSVTIGTTITTWFKSGQKIQFRDTGGIASFAATLFEINFAGSGLRVDITGGSIGAAGTQDYLFDAADTNIVSFDMLGVQLAKANSILFEAGQTIDTCVFDACGQIVPKTSTFSGHTISNSVDAGGAVLFPTDDSNFSGCEFVNNDKAIEYDATSDATTPALTDMIFDDVGGNFDINNTSGSSVSLSLSGTSNANSYTGSLVTFLSSSTLTMVVRDEAGGFIDVAHAYIDDNNLTPFIMNKDTNASGVASTTWSGGAVAGATWRVRKYGFKPYTAIADVPASGAKEIPVTLIVDPQQT